MLAPNSPLAATATAPAISTTTTTTYTKYNGICLRSEQRRNVALMTIRQDHKISSNKADTILISLVHAYDWPPEIASASPRTPWKPASFRKAALHVACENDAPAVVIQSLLAAYPKPPCS
jgi:hypothetical protein